MNRADIGMIQRRGGFGFAPEAGESFRVVGDIGRKKFEGNEAVEAGVRSFEDDTHSTTAKLGDDAVTKNGLPDERF